MSTQLMQVQVPAGVYAGQQFQIQVGAQLMAVTCPQNAGPGMTIQIQVPVAGGGAAAAGGGAGGAGAAPGPAAGSPEAMFQAIDRDRSGTLAAAELQTALSSGHLQFQMKTIRLMIAMFDQDRTGTINQREFVGLFNFLMEWKKCFDGFDADKSGNIDKQELSTCLQTFGYRFSPQMFEYLFNTYDADRSGHLGFDEYIQICCELKMLTDHFKVYDVQRVGQITINYEQFLKVAMSFKT